MNYGQCLQRLYALNRYQKIKYDLDNVRRLARAYGDPQDSLEVVHVTGTNGKGSVTFKMAKLLEANGHRTGMFTSPHLTTFRERFQIDGELIPREYVTDFLREAFRKRDQMNLSFSFFELLTVMAFRYFADQKVDFVSLEVGIGGRLDCTNIIPRNKLAIITAVGLDHCEILGDTVEAITREKCGLIKRGCPTVIGPNVDVSIAGQFCRDLDSPLSVVQAPKGASFFEINQEIARVSARTLSAHWGMGLRVDEEVLKLNLPGRAESVPLMQLPSGPANQPEAVYLDVGHNPMAIEFLCDMLRRRHPTSEFILVFGTSGLKNSGDMLRTLRALSPKVYLVQADSPRAKSIGVLKQEAAMIGTDGFECIESGSIAKTLTYILQKEKTKGKVLVVCGSFFIMPEARVYLGYDDEVDELFLNEYSLEMEPPVSGRL